MYIQTVINKISFKFKHLDDFQPQNRHTMYDAVVEKSSRHGQKSHLHFLSGITVFHGRYTLL